jgi:DNA-binding LytR/AlgR family response regulator
LGIIDLDFFEGHNVEVNLDLFKRFLIISSKNEIPSRWYSENTIDILKKPINLLRIKSAFNKVSKSIGRVNKNTKTEQKLMQNIELPGHLKKVRRVNKIAFIQRLSGNRLDCVRTLGFNTTATPNLLSLVKQSPNFMWVHDNYIVNKRHIKCQESSQLSIAGKTIPIGSEFKAVVD